MFLPALEVKVSSLNLGLTIFISAVTFGEDYLYSYIHPPSSLSSSSPIFSFFPSPSLLLSPPGIFVTNLAARNQQLHDSTLAAIGPTFSLLLTIPVPEDVNEIIVGLPQTRDDIIGDSADQSDHSRRSVVISVDLKDSVTNLTRMIVARSSSLDFETVEKELLECLESSSCVMYH